VRTLTWMIPAAFVVACLMMAGVILMDFWRPELRAAPRCQTIRYSGHGPLCMNPGPCLPRGKRRAGVYNLCMEEE
jgi:hypothetical protein